MLFAEAFVTLWVIMDPVGNVPVFLALTRRDDPLVRRRAGLQAAGVAAAVIVSFALFGELVLRLLGISIESLQVAGGLLLVLVALELLQPGRHSEPVRHPGTNAAFVPLGTPLLAGPGAIAAVMVYARQVDDVGEATAVVLALMAVLVAVYLALRYAAGLVGSGRTASSCCPRWWGFCLPPSPCRWWPPASSPGSSTACPNHDAHSRLSYELGGEPVRTVVKRC